ncbi:alpha/beta fold hydrolase [Halosolutus gelatinilyticus]|uniref:alpha/beta fold hydrolase n=1 Tax=Halosolutus gelatinilyticus TaxID=2931975 RepID=UPI001FF4B393|nr:alpha/beta hydrolase [Halosolutus gelatinilyticus]
MDHRMFDPQIAPLVDEGYRVVTWDVRGHGQSKPIGDEFTVSTVADDLLALIDHLGHETAILIGQSFGGYVSQEVVFRHPARVDAVVVIGTTDITTLPSRLERLGLKLSPYLFKVWPAGHLRTLIAENTAVTPDVQQYAADAAGQMTKQEFVTVWKAVATCLHEEPGYRIQQPFLLTHGEYDETGIISKAAPGWADREPNCRYEVIPDAGHNANQDNPDVFNRILLAFLEETVSD